MINPHIVQIVEVIRRSTQGVTRPFLCRGDDQALYYVKGRNAGRRSLVAEWLGSSMAAAFHLPVAPFCIGEVDPDLIRYGPPELAELGSGYVFASRVIDNVLEIAWSNVSSVGVAVRRDLVVFDYWVRNQDRTLTERGGNPNLLWEPTGMDLFVIDHNQAFDEDFDDTSFFQTHVFAQSWNDVYQDFFDRPRYEQRMQAALEQFDDACDRMPESWLIVDEGVPGGLQPDRARALLMKFSRDNFWSQR